MSVNHKNDNLDILLGFSLLSGILVIITSALGIILRDEIYHKSTLLTSFVPTDVLNLFIVSPILLIIIWYTKRNSIQGLLLLPGILFYNVYIYSVYMIGTEFNPLFVPYMLIVSLSLYTLIAYIWSLDNEKLGVVLSNITPRRIHAVLFLGIVGIFLSMQISDMINPERDVNATDIGQWIADFVIFMPALLLGGILLIKRKKLGYVLSPPLLLVTSLSFLGLIPYLITLAIITSNPLPWADIIFVGIFGLVAFLPLLNSMYRIKNPDLAIAS